MQRSPIWLFLEGFMALALLSGCQGVGQILQPTPTLTSPPPTLTPTPSITLTPSPRPPQPVQIDTSVTRQTLREVGGGNFIHYFGGVETAFDPVSILNLNTLIPNVIRTRMDLNEWEPNPGAPTSERFHNSGHVKATFEFLQEVKTKIPDITFIASIWEVPNWMVTNPDAADNRIIPPENYEAAVELDHRVVEIRARPVRRRGGLHLV